MRYGYRCPRCGPQDSAIRADTILCHCGLTAKRDWKFRFRPSLPEHFSPAFGQVITSERQARELAKAASAENYLRTGIESDYQIIDAHDDEAVGIDTAEKEAAAEERRRRTVNGAAWTAKRLREIEQAQEKARQESVADFTIDTQPGAVTV